MDRAQTNGGLDVVRRPARARGGDGGALRGASCFTNESMFSPINQNAPALAAVIPGKRAETGTRQKENLVQVSALPV